MSFERALLILMLIATTAWAKAAQATIIGFDYLLHVTRTETFGTVPASWLSALSPIKVGTVAHGSMYFHSDLPAVNSSKTQAVYSDILPFNGAGYMNFHVPNQRLEGTFPQIILQVFNDEPVAADIYDGLVVRLGGGGAGAVLPGFGDPSAAGVHGELTIVLDSIGPAGQFLAPFSSTALPTTPPKLSDFNRFHQWNLILQRPGSSSTPGWGVVLAGQVVSLAPSAAPEPSSVALLVAAAGALGVVRRKSSGRRARHRE
jgi:hypothetical protein